jgi:hypothetical protein
VTDAKRKARRRRSLFGEPNACVTRGVAGRVAILHDDPVTVLLTVLLALGMLPLTIRQIYYRLVARYAFPKTEKAYKNVLVEHLNTARRAKWIDAIRDDGFTVERPYFFQSVDDFLEIVREDAARLQLDRQAGQPRRLALWCEAGGMVPQLARVARPFGIEVCSSGGFDSLTAKHGVAKQWITANEPMTVLHIGDYDPSGVHCYSALAEDVIAFADNAFADVAFERVAITREQAKFYDLPSAPPKDSDKRSSDDIETWQAEALDPAVLAQIVRTAIEAQLDREAFDRVLEDEKDARRRLLSRLGGNSSERQ